jgi:hypothetical protein
MRDVIRTGGAIQSAVAQNRAPCQQGVRCIRCLRAARTAQALKRFEMQPNAREDVAHVVSGLSRRKAGGIGCDNRKVHHGTNLLLCSDDSHWSTVGRRNPMPVAYRIDRRRALE